MKKILCMLLALVIIFSAAGCSGGSPGSPETPEVAAAIQAELVPGYLQKDLSQQITYEEFCALIDQFYAVMYPHSVNAWETVSAGFRTAQQPMTRAEGMMVFLYAAETVGLEAANYEYYTPVEDHFARENPDKDFWEGVVWNTDLLPNMHEQYHNEVFLNDERYAWRCDHSYMSNAV